MLAAPPPASVTVATSGSATLSAATDDDAVEEPDSTVTATLSSGSGYSVGSPGSASVTVTDNDSGTDPPSTGDPTVRMVSATPNPVPEGGTVRITMSMSRAATGRIRVSLDAIDSEISRNHDGVGAAAFADGSTTATARFEVIDTDFVSTSRTVSFILYDEDAGYAIGTPSELTVNVTDVVTQP